MTRKHFAFCIFAVCLSPGCASERPDAGDLGQFLPSDAAVAVDVTGLDAAGGEAVCYDPSIVPDPHRTQLSVVGQMFEMSWTNLFPGDYRGDVGVKVIDACGQEVHAFDVLPSGSYAFHMPVGEAGFDGYFEFPYRPKHVAEAAWDYGQHALFREFDKPFAGQYMHVNLRLFAPDIVKFATALVKQKEELGYVQGTVYRWLDYETLQGARVNPSSGKVWYISNAHVPDSALKETQNKGMFVVSNAAVGRVDLEILTPSGKSFVKTVRAWPLNSHPNRLLTNVGVPVAPEYL